MRLFVFFALLGSALASPNRIIGGSVTNVETYPYMSNMQGSYWGIWWNQECGGSLITSTAVLSAAHCFYGDRIPYWRVVLGSSLAHSSGTVHTVSRIIMHPQYIHSILNNDVAIVRLNNPAVFSNRIQLARIPGANYNLADGASVTHVGWGHTQHGGQSSEQLLHVHVNVINQQVCAARYAYLKTQPGYQDWPDINDGMVCAGILDVGGKDACQGDSGGPLAHFGDIIVGVTSWGFECAHSFYPGVSARVSHYSNWIVANASS
uniref:Trypsin AiT9 n=1 Tax=Agrotis ipsilon TaxID=56364 RepID=Q9NB91_AGRIP|nr:trypsin precursor AiT9 [Agrotis ipsilon]AAF74752.2 trypsin precursor AiT9 [Agrotis ipsilon]